MTEKYFDIERDKLLPYWCQACLVGKESGQMSPDPRYCNGCYELLVKEAQMLTRHADWMPQDGKISPENMGTTNSLNTEPAGVLLYLKSEKSQSYQNPARTTKVNLGGRPRKDIPVKLIHKLSKQGLSIGKITRELKAQGQPISAMSVQRVLSGERM